MCNSPQLQFWSVLQGHRDILMQPDREDKTTDSEWQHHSSSEVARCGNRHSGSKTRSESRALNTLRCVCGKLVVRQKEGGKGRLGGKEVIPNTKWTAILVFLETELRDTRSY